MNKLKEIEERWKKDDKYEGGMSEEMDVANVMKYLEAHGQHFTCEHNSNFGQSVCSRASELIETSHDDIRSLLSMVKEHGKALGKWADYKRKLYAFWAAK
jgi:hypothetical protein